MINIIQNQTDSFLKQNRFFILAHNLVYRLSFVLFIKITSKIGVVRMKKIIAGLALLSASSVAMAEAPGGPNCGWGNMLFEGQSGLGSHIIATITNGTSGNATFGMTTGTNGCSTSGTLTYGGKSMVSSIMGEFSEDVARGEGDAMDTVAVIYGVEKQDRATFAKVMHENFAVIFPSEDVTADDMMASIEEVMKADSTLAKYIA